MWLPLFAVPRPVILRLESDMDELLMHDEQTRVFVVALTRIARCVVVWAPVIMLSLYYFGAASLVRDAAYVYG